MPVRRNFIFDPAIIFLILGLFIGSVYCIVIPYGAGFDEEGHMVRIYQMSEAKLLPILPHPVIFSEIFDLSYQRRPIQTPAFDMFSPESFWRKFSRLEENYRYGYKTRSIYSPVIFLPQALVTRLLWQYLDFAILPTIILARLAGLLVYIAGCYMAIRALPFGKWTMLALALAPMAMFQAATLNADGFTNAVSFAFIAWVYHVYLDEKKGIRPRSIWILIGLSLLVGSAKPGAIIILPLLLILTKDMFPSKKWMALLALGALLAILWNIGWIAFAIPNSTFSADGSQSLPRQLGFVLADPGAFISTFLRGIVSSIVSYIQDWIAAYGYWAGTIPGPVYFFYALLLLAALLAEPHAMGLPTKIRIFTSLLGLLCSAITVGMFFVVTYTPGGAIALGKHGRYFIPFAPLFFLSLSGLVSIREKWRKIAQFIALGSLLIVAGYYSFGMYTTYYTYCGYEAYAGGPCTLPVYKNLEKEAAQEIVLGDGTLVSQTFTSYCNGLEAVQVFVKSVPENRVATLEFSLLDGDQHGLSRQQISFAEIQPDNYLNFDVGPSTGLQGTDYEIRLASSAYAPSEGISLSTTASDYYAGQLVVDGQAIGSDLLIHYVCAHP